MLKNQKMNMWKHVCVILMLAALPYICRGALSQPCDIMFKAAIDGTEQYYMEMLPADFDKDKKYKDMNYFVDVDFE